MSDTLQDRIKRSEIYRLVRLYGTGLNRRELEGFLRRDTVQAYTFYNRDRERLGARELPRGGLKRAVAIGKSLFLSFLLKLTPARRLVYGIALVLFVASLLDGDWNKTVLAFLAVNVLLAMELADKLLTKDELEIARAIQLSLQPRQKPDPRRVALACHFQPARDVGGDYYDFLPVDESRLTLILGDVSGKGMPAALYAMRLQGLFQLLGKSRAGPREMLIEMNEVFCEKLRTDYFITALVGVMDFRASELLLARAGHNLPLHFCAATGATHWLRPGGLGIGMKSNPGFGELLEEVSVPFSVGDVLLFYTDGITEAMNPRDQIFGYRRLEEILARHGDREPEQIKTSVLDQLEAFTEGVPLDDDATLVVAKVVG